MTTNTDSGNSLNGNISEQLPGTAGVAFEPVPFEQLGIHNITAMSGFTHSSTEELRAQDYQQNNGSTRCVHQPAPTVQVSVPQETTESAPTPTHATHGGVIRSSFGFVPTGSDGSGSGADAGFGSSQTNFGANESAGGSPFGGAFRSSSFPNTGGFGGTTGTFGQTATTASNTGGMFGQASTQGATLDKPGLFGQAAQPTDLPTSLPHGTLFNQDKQGNNSRGGVTSYRSTFGAPSKAAHGSSNGSGVRLFGAAEAAHGSSNGSGVSLFGAATFGRSPDGSLFGPSPYGGLFGPSPGGSLSGPSPGGSLFRPSPGGSLFRPSHGGSLFRPSPGGSLFGSQPSTPGVGGDNQTQLNPQGGLSFQPSPNGSFGGRTQVQAGGGLFGQAAGTNQSGPPSSVFGAVTSQPPTAGVELTAEDTTGNFASQSGAGGGGSGALTQTGGGGGDSGAKEGAPVQKVNESTNSALKAPESGEQNCLQPDGGGKGGSSTPSPSAAQATLDLPKKPPPRSFICPIGLCIMEHPTTILSTGISYDKKSLRTWFAARNLPIPPHMDNKTLKDLIVEWRVEHDDLTLPPEDGKTEQSGT